MNIANLPEQEQIHQVHQTPQIHQNHQNHQKMSCTFETQLLSDAISDDDVKARLNEICNIAFKRGSGGYVDTFPGSTRISVARNNHDNQLYGVAFAEKKSYDDADPAYVSCTQYHVHSISVHPDARKQGLCKGLMKALIKSCKTADPKTPLYLNVRISKTDPNKGGIKCYERFGFQIVAVPPVMRDDGPNFYMVLDPSAKKKSTKKTKKPKRRRRSKR
jgi:ribosomal protein S18 acetylase RimI-like enzyme